MIMKFDWRAVVGALLAVVVLATSVSLLNSEIGSRAKYYVLGVAIALFVVVALLLTDIVLVARQRVIITRRFPQRLVVGIRGRDESWNAIAPGSARSSYLARGALVADYDNLRVLKGLTDPAVVAVISGRLIQSVDLVHQRVGFRTAPCIQIAFIATDGAISRVQMALAGQGRRSLVDENPNSAIADVVALSRWHDSLSGASTDLAENNSPTPPSP
jgi:hypothetical protein